MNVIRVFWRRCQEHKAKAVPRSPIPACPCSLRWQPGEEGSLNTQLLLFCLGTVLVSALCLGPLPKPHVFSLKAWMQNYTKCFQNSQPGSALPGGDRAAEWQGWNQRPSECSPPKLWENIPCCWAPSGGTLATGTRTATSTWGGLLFQEGQELPYPTNCWSCYLPF